MPLAHAASIDSFCGLFRQHQMKCEAAIEIDKEREREREADKKRGERA